MSSEWFFTIHGWWRIYWGVERYVEGWSFNRRVLSLDSMTELEKPYRVGRAIRLRLWHRAYHLGLCRLAERPPGRELPDVSIDDISEQYQGIGTDIWDS